MGKELVLLDAVGAFVLTLLFVTLGFVIGVVTGDDSLDWNALVAMATVALAVLGILVRNDFIRQSAFKQAMESIEIILCRRIMMYPIEAQASIVKFDKLMAKVVFEVGKNPDSSEFTLIRKQLDTAINRYFTVIDDLVFVRSRCLYLGNHKDLKVNSDLFSSSLVDVIKVGNGFFAALQYQSDIMGDKDFCLFAASIATGAGIVEGEEALHEKYKSIIRNKYSSVTFNELADSIERLRDTAECFLKPHISES